MAEPTNRKQFKDYIMRRLGAPVQQIHVDNEQVEDRIDDALNYFYDYHYLGSESSFYAYEITLDDKKNGYITIPENIISIETILPATSGVSGSRDRLFDVDSHIRYDLMSNLASGSLIPYYLAMTRMEDLDYLIGSSSSLSFHRHRNQVTINSGWSRFGVGQKIVMKVVSVLDSKAYSDIWKDRWLKEYATALVKRQWGENIKVFGGVQLLGGITLDGKTIYDEAVETIRTLEEKMINSYSSPPMDMIG